ncbi:formate dehydrogenase accessory sulfurtransferase FdhD [Acuticoccus sediminis]|uniref:Sulfur carrier protein FdhD n=1 Tax=Acuticoccus sediminis TaxID=2184697 RepID=A0A8B2NSJ4_9HYPH|nr:formate dehydrogenase accessory sulfurtransferase FdhD [Acuticoccus sediminis]RAH98352.1 formate dehydrogenase accessory sulfurtransferase FdhD [Acuticoccus sediminis]
MIPAPTERHSCIAWRNLRALPSNRHLPEETPVAITYRGSTHAVMMATPADLEDFATGFSLSEGAAATAADVLGTEILEWDEGVELRVTLSDDAGTRVAERRRAMAGPVGCGLCGLDSLAEAARLPPPVVTDATFSARDLVEATATLSSFQTLNGVTRAMHAAAFWSPRRAIETVREDVGRHNALDKLSGALARTGCDAAGGAVIMTSRVSVELVQKTAILGAPVLVAISAPTALAVRVATAAGVTLACVTRRDGFDVFTHPDRIRFDDEALAFAFASPGAPAARRPATCASPAI